MNNRLSVNLNGRKSYDIVIASSYEGLKEELLNIGCRGKKICIVTDDYVSGFYLESVYGVVTEIASETAVYAFHEYRKFPSASGHLRVKKHNPDPGR